jgi:hypothetical protein
MNNMDSCPHCGDKSSSSSVRWMSAKGAAISSDPKYLAPAILHKAVSNIILCTTKVAILKIHFFQISYDINTMSYARDFLVVPL